jgi:hypothetical protein
MGKALAKDNMKLFSEKVMPRLRGLFSAWEDKWWPGMGGQMVAGADGAIRTRRADAAPCARDCGGITKASLAAARAAGEQEAGRRIR